MNATTSNVRNLSGVSLSEYDRDFIAGEVESYLEKKNDCPLLVISRVSNGMYELEGTRAVKEGYTVEEMVEDLKEDLCFPDYADQVWFVCKLSKSLKTIMVREVIRED